LRRRGPHEGGLGRRIGVREEAATAAVEGSPWIGIEIRNGVERALTGLRTQSERNGIAGLVPFVAGWDAEEDTRGAANAVLPLPNGSHAKPRRGETW